MMKIGAVLKEMFLVFVAVLFLAVAYVMDEQLYLLRLEAGTTFVFQPLFLLMSVSRLVTAVFLMGLIWLTVMRQQGAFIFSLLCLILGLLIVFNVPLDFAISSFPLSQWFGFSLGAITFGNSRLSDVGTMLAVIGMWRMGQLFIHNRRTSV